MVGGRAPVRGDAKGCWGRIEPGVKGRRGVPIASDKAATQVSALV
jgi:hypothetical protein